MTSHLTGTLAIYHSFSFFFLVHDCALRELFQVGADRLRLSHFAPTAASA